jgi:hypothetical protein
VAALTMSSRGAVLCAESIRGRPIARTCARRSRGGITAFYGYSGGCYPSGGAAIVSAASIALAESGVNVSDHPDLCWRVVLTPMYEG